MWNKQKKIISKQLNKCLKGIESRRKQANRQPNLEKSVPKTNGSLVYLKAIFSYVRSFVYGKSIKNKATLSETQSLKDGA